MKRMKKVIWGQCAVVFPVAIPHAGKSRQAVARVLVCLDVESHTCVHHAIVIDGARDGVSAGELCAAMRDAWRAHGVPETSVIELRGSWKSERVLDLARQAGTRLVDGTGRPDPKTAKRWFTRLAMAHQLIGSGDGGELAVSRGLDKAVAFVNQQRTVRRPAGKGVAV